MSESMRAKERGEGEEGEREESLAQEEGVSLLMSIMQVRVRDLAVTVSHLFCTLAR